MRRAICLSIAVITSALVAGCEPEDRTPGLWLSGTEQSFPADWGFTRAHREIALEVNTPYLVSHSITIWCVELDGDLYIAAGNPVSKNWPGWVDDDPNVRLKIGEDIFEARLVPLDDDEHIMRVRAVQASKYDRDPPSGPTTSRFWIVEARARA
ncbi:MAG: hypothetical protein O7H39_01875 [Gammaproteobacteria bacterium]|nr:hypothetical protein [Gammaproteobacteria bacterium]